MELLAVSVGGLLGIWLSVSRSADVLTDKLKASAKKAATSYTEAAELTQVESGQTYAKSDRR